MPTYAQTTDVAARIGGRPFSATTVPSTTQAEAMLDSAEAELLGTLEAVGVSSSYAPASRGFAILQGWIAEYVTGLLRRAMAAAAGDGTNPDGQQQIDEWRDRLRWILDNPSIASSMLEGSGTPEDATPGIESHLTDRVLGLSRENVAPVYTIKGHHF